MRVVRPPPSCPASGSSEPVLPAWLGYRLYNVGMRMNAQTAMPPPMPPTRSRMNAQLPDVAALRPWWNAAVTTQPYSHDNSETAHHA